MLADNMVRNALLAYVEEGNILGKEITVIRLFNFLESQKISLKHNNLDNKVRTRIDSLNMEYERSFCLLKDGMIPRTETLRCLEVLNAEKNIVIHGKAGYGKSGCTQEIIAYCKDNQIPYLAIKLDRHIPSRCCDAWGKELGLPKSPTYCLDELAQNEKAVLLLDQLDALRWTQANSAASIGVCMELINQVNFLNANRKKKIIIVLICRTYDMENDTNIGSLFNKQCDEGLLWEKVQVECLDETTVARIVGDRYPQLSLKLRAILKIPSNLYVWQKLDKDKTYHECVSTEHLIKEWYAQIKRKGKEVGIEEQSIERAKDYVVNAMEQAGKLYTHVLMVNKEEIALDYLQAVGMLNVQDDKVSFAHQSFLDCFIVEQMIVKYYQNKELVEIVGSKEQQNPARRYQVQMLMQNILEYSSEDFLKFGKRLILSDEIRYYIKYLFYEILGQIDKVDETIATFVLAHYDEPIFVDTVIYGRAQYVHILRDKQIVKNDEIMLKLLISIKGFYDKKDIEILKCCAFEIDMEADKIQQCFSYDILNESDGMFAFALEFYRQHPDMIQDLYIDFQKEIQCHEIRTIQLLTCMIDAKTKLGNKMQYKENWILSGDKINIQNAEEVLNLLLPYIPKKKLEKCGEWSARYSYNVDIERMLVEVIKCAGEALILENPEAYFNIYKDMLGKGYTIFNEILLHGMFFLPKKYSTKIIEYCNKDLENRIFDLTSGNKDELGLIKKVYQKHSENCSNEAFEKLQNAIIHYWDSRIIQWYKSRVEYKKNNGIQAYWSFWGDFQYEILPYLCQERISAETKKLKEVLQRRFVNGSMRYRYNEGHSGFVRSAIAEKVLTPCNWLQIITDRNLEQQEHRPWKEVQGGFIENSVEEFAGDFREVFEKEPEKTLRMILENKDRVLAPFVDEIFISLAYGEQRGDIPVELIIRLLTEVPCIATANRAQYACHVVMKYYQSDWPEQIICLLKDIATNFDDESNITYNEGENAQNISSDMLLQYIINTVHSEAADAIGALIKENEVLYPFFQSTIEGMLKDDNVIIQYASLGALLPICKIDANWASKRILELLKKDTRILYFYGVPETLTTLYTQHSKDVENIVIKCFWSDDKGTMEAAAHLATNFYFEREGCEKIIHNIEKMNQEQINAILDQAIIFFTSVECSEKVKEILFKCVKNHKSIKRALDQMFYNDFFELERDKEFLLQVMHSGQGKEVIDSFVNYLENNAFNLIDFSDVIIALANSILVEKEENLQRRWGLTEGLSKLIAGLFDETYCSEKQIHREISLKCMDIWDGMFEKKIGSMRVISKMLMER